MHMPRVGPRNTVTVDGSTVPSANEAADFGVNEDEREYVRSRVGRMIEASWQAGETTLV